MSDDDSAELKLAKKIRAEAEQLKKSAPADLEAAKDEHARAARCLRDTAELERNIAAREHRLKTELAEDVLRAREAAAAAKLAEAKDLMSRYDNDKHGAAIALQQINEREKREQAAA
jgi:hypothetical protein